MVFCIATMMLSYASILKCTRSAYVSVLLYNGSNHDTLSLPPMTNDKTSPAENGAPLPSRLSREAYIRITTLVLVLWLVSTVGMVVQAEVLTLDSAMGYAGLTVLVMSWAVLAAPCKRAGPSQPPSA